jgi:hypothetical protein
MTNLPPDWKGDERLWEVLGKAPQTRVPTNFAYMVRQKLAETKQVKPRQSWLHSLRWLFRGVGIAAACSIVFMVSLKMSQRSDRPEWQTTQAVVSVDTSDPKMELAAIAQDYELIQDLEVIQHLDQL